MRVSVVLLVVALAGVLGGGALIGTWALGVCLIADSAALGAWALLRDDGTGVRPAARAGVRTLEEYLREKAAEQ